MIRSALQHSPALKTPSTNPHGLTRADCLCQHRLHHAGDQVHVGHDAREARQARRPWPQMHGADVAWGEGMPNKGQGLGAKVEVMMP